MNIKLSIAFILLLNFSIGLFAQDGLVQKNAIDDALNFHLLDVESGLSNNFINSIEQDSLGFIWIGTADGLNRYDGTQFINYNSNPDNGLSNNNISKIKYHKQTNELIIATDDGLNRYIPELDEFKPYLNTNDKLHKFVNHFNFDTKGNLIFSLLREDEGLYVLNQQELLQSFYYKENQSESLSSNEISSFSFQGDSILWIGTFHGGLNKMNYANKKITRVYSSNRQFPNSINEVFVDSNDNVWVGSKDGIRVITNQSDTLSLKASDIPGKGLSDNNVLSFEEDNQGRMWIGTRNGGLNIVEIAPFLEKNDAISIKWYLPKNDATSVYNRTVSSIKKDAYGNMWLGTSTGLNFVNPRDEPVKLLQNNKSDNQTISHNRIGSLALASNNKLWIGTDGGGLDLFNPKNGEFKHFTHDKNNLKSLSNNYVISLLEDSKKRVWVGTYQGGLNLLNTTSGESKKFIQEGDIRVVFEDDNQHIWVGTNRGGLYTLNEENETFEYVSILGNIDIRDIEQGPEHTLWIATYGEGIIKFNTTSDAAVYYNTKNTKGLKTNIFFSILALKDGDLLLGSRYEGLIRFNPSTKTISNFTVNDGLSNNTIVSIVQENEAYVWLGTSNGINRYDIEKNKTYDLSALNNIQISEFNIGAAIKGDNGYLYFGGNKGLNIFYPKRLQKDQNNYNLVFNNLLVFNKSVPIQDKNDNSILNKSISYANQVNLNYDHTLVTVGFTVLKYPEAKNINYSYLLEGYHEHWIKLKGLGLANLSKTPPGNYKLKIKALLDSGEEVTNQLYINIQPPFWETLPAYLVYILLITGLIVFGLKYYSERLKLKNSLLFEKKQRQLEHDLNEERIHFFTNFSHELKTPLTLILAPLEDLIHQLTEKKHLKKAKLIKKNADTLYQSINKLLKFRKSETGLSQLHLENKNVSQLLKQTSQSFMHLSEKMKIKMKLSMPDEDIIAPIDTEKFQIIMNNLISNAVKYCREQDVICIGLSANHNTIKIQVKDTGLGVDKKDLPYIFDWYYQSGKSPKKKGSGIGLALTKSFVELHKGIIYASNNKDTSGVTFTIEIPENQDIKTPLNINSPKLENKQIDNLWGASSILISNKEKKKKIQLNVNRKLILLVDDNYDIINYLESILKDDYDLIFAYDGKDGIEKAIKYVPDLVISDVMMPQKSGVDLCNHLKNQISTTHIPIILLTAKNSTESIKSGYEEGADAYITKPFNSEILKTRIQNLLISREKLKTYFTAQEPIISELSSSNLKLLDKEKKFLYELKKIILKNLKTESISVDSIARDIGMSRSSLYRKITAITDKNINEYIRKVRIEKALHLIQEENMTISQASYEVGFNSIKYFRKVFKEELGDVPSKFKKKN